jgi:hypothetical protein
MGRTLRFRETQHPATETSDPNNNTIGKYTLRQDQKLIAERAYKHLIQFKSVVIKAPAGLGKSLIAAMMLKMLCKLYKNALGFTVFPSKKLAAENYGMYDIPPENKHIQAAQIESYCLRKQTSIKNQLFGITIQGFTKLIQDDESDESDESDEFNGDNTTLGKIVSQGKVQTVVITFDECHAITSQNTKRNCENVDKIRKYLKNKGVKLFIVGNSATPDAKGSLRTKAYLVDQNISKLYNTALHDITITPTDEEISIWRKSNWQGFPTNTSFTERHVLKIRDGYLDRLYDMVLLTALFTSPTSDGIACDQYEWGVWERCEDPHIEHYKSLQDYEEDNELLYPFLKSAFARSKRRKKNSHLLMLSAKELDEIEDEIGHYDLTNTYVEFDGVTFVPKKMKNWKSKDKQVGIKTRLNTLINTIEIDSFVHRSFVNVTNDDIFWLTKIKNMHIVEEVKNDTVTKTRSDSNICGCALVYIPTNAASSMMRKQIMEYNGDDDEPNQWYDFMHPNRNEVDQQINTMLENVKKGHRMQVGLISTAHTIGTSVFGKNVQAIIAIGGSMDTTRKTHLYGRIARLVPPKVGDVYTTNRPIVEHARNKLCSDIQSSMEGGSLIEESAIDGDYKEMYKTVQTKYNDDSSKFLSLFDKYTGKPFQILESKDLAKDFLQALQERDDYNEQVHHGSDGTKSLWYERFHKLHDHLQDIQNRITQDHKYLKEGNTKRGNKRAREE